MRLRRSAYRIALCTVCFLAPVMAAEPDVESDYAVLLARAKLDPARADFAKLRIAFTKTPAYEPYGTSPSDYKEVEAATQAGDWERARDLVDALLQKNYVRIRSHYFAWVVYRRAGDEERAKHHRAFMDGLFRSITTSGDGKTAESPYIVINVEEEYDVLGLTGLKMLGQSLQHANGRDFDVLTVQQREGAEPMKLYFDITLPWKNSPIGKETQAK
jgi:Domain of unknown function (DUF4919)